MTNISPPKKNYWNRAATVCLAAGALWFCVPVFAGVINVGNLLGIAVCLFLLLWLHSYRLLEKIASRHGAERFFSTVHRLLICFVTIGSIWCVFLTGLMIWGSFGNPPAGATVVVLGSQVRGDRPSLDLWERINTAAVYLESRPEAVCIASGGQGQGEWISEAQAIRDNLQTLGIDSSRIYMDGASSNTRENLENTWKIIEENGLSGQIALVTDEYHQFRAGLLARRVGLEPYPVCANTPWYIFPACYGRELLAITKDLIFV